MHTHPSRPVFYQEVADKCGICKYPLLLRPKPVESEARQTAEVEGFPGIASPRVIDTGHEGRPGPEWLNPARRSCSTTNRRPSQEDVAELVLGSPR